MRKQKEMNNKGFSLVELIVVIAIMVVLVAVLAPVFTKYVEQSRRATDIQNANAIAEAVLIDAAEDKTKFNETLVVLTDDNKPEAIASIPDVKGKLFVGEDGKTNAKFLVAYNKATNQATVVIGTDATKATGNLTDEDEANEYKEATTVPGEEAPAQ